MWVCGCQPTATQTNNTWARQPVFYSSPAKAFSMWEDWSSSVSTIFALVWPTRAAQPRNIFASGRGKLAFYRIYHRTVRIFFFVSIIPANILMAGWGNWGWELSRERGRRPAFSCSLAAICTVYGVFKSTIRKGGKRSDGRGGDGDAAWLLARERAMFVYSIVQRHISFTNTGSSLEHVLCQQRILRLRRIGHFESNTAVAFRGEMTEAKARHVTSVSKRTIAC